MTVDGLAPESLPELLVVAFSEDGLEPWASLVVLLVGEFCGALNWSLDPRGSLDLPVSFDGLAPLFDDLPLLLLSLELLEVDDDELLRSLEAGLPSAGSSNFGQLFFASPGARISSSFVMFRTRYSWPGFGRREF